MARIPSLQDFERGGVADFADDDAVGTKPKRHLHKIAHGDLRRRALGQELDDIGARALEFGGVLEDEHARVRKLRFGEEGVEQRGLARASAAGDDDIAAAHDRGAHLRGLRRRGDAVAHIVVEREDDGRALADGERWRCNDRRDHGLHTRARARQRRREVGLILCHGDVSFGRQEAHGGFAFGGGQPDIACFDASAHAIDAQAAIGIDEHFDHGLVGERFGERGAQCARKRGEAPFGDASGAVRRRARRSCVRVRLAPMRGAR